MSNSIYFKADSIMYYIPEINPGEEQLRSIFYKHARKSRWNVSNIFSSSWARARFSRPISKSTKELFDRIREVEGRGSKMAFKVLKHHPNDPIIILGIDGKTGKFFEAKYAETEMQRVALMYAYDAITKLKNTSIAPKVLQFISRPDCSFLRTEYFEGEKLYEKEMNEGILNYLVNITQYSLNQTREENSLGLITCLSNGSFGPWNAKKDKNGNYHWLQWQHAADRPLGYDLLYYLFKPFIEHDESITNEELQEQHKWISKFYSMFGIENYTQYVDTNTHIYAAQLESEGRYVEATRLRIICRATINHYCAMSGESENGLLTRNKVLFIMHMPPPVHGAAMVGKWIHESEYINSKFDCYYLNLTFASGASDIGHFSFMKVLRLIKLISTVKKHVKTIKPDLVYMTPNAAGMPFLKDSFVVNAVKSMGCRVLAHFHNKGVSKYENIMFFRHRYRKFFKGLRVLLIVPSLYEDVKNYVRIPDLYICPNGAPSTLEEEIEAERHNEVPEIVFLSNMIVSKGVFDLLDALYLMRGQGYKFHCTLIGEETAELSSTQIKEEIQSRNLSDCVEYIGPRYGSEKNQYLQRADIMTLPTYYPLECFPLVILEAMEYKIPIVSTNEGGIPHSVLDGKTGFLCKSQNPTELSDKLVKLIENPELRWKMGEAGYQLRKQKFTLETFEKNLVSVLERNIEK